MIKFWKSAAKGKTGCPVRPPELNDTNNVQLKTPINLEIGVNVEDLANVFEKKSKLSLNIHDILIEKKSIKHFISFMEAIGKLELINCWLELDKFETNIHKGLKETLLENNIEKMNSCQCECNKLPNDYKDMMSQTVSLSKSTSNLSQYKSEISKNSLSYCYESENTLETCITCGKFINVTQEAVKLFKRYIALEAPHKIDLPENVRKCVISNICQPGGMIKKDCFKPVQDTLFLIIQNSYIDDFLISPYYIKAQIDILTAGSINLQDILYNETILFYFTEYLEQETCSIFLEFIMAVMHFRENLINNNSSNAEQAQGDAIVLYDKYFSLQATNPIGFPTEIRLQIESDICREGGPLPTCFDLPYKIIFKTLTNYAKLFLGSEVYYNYLSEMINSVDNLWNSKFKSHSDCSSEFSISTQNTLLAMGDPFYKKKRNHSVPDMTIDSNQLYNADSLWQRKKHDGLILGRINSLGRFESKFEPDPDKKHKSVLKKMVSRFVPTNSGVEEEMAWQVAHMIVKDITDLTMAPPENDHDV
ncbi:A-kinase anchor protein 10, mitochondrial [Papilio machaon]|uniref:A-kinase anchor protein 10, mitochondrial n=1 Tax=Papilio machaon TaxID=76193 RepID=UPI001E663048|nr:A-kinase anchor protein 10, mitochondrial [Papilio machaon]